VTCNAPRACRPHPRLPPLTCSSHCTLQQLTDDDIAPLCANLGRFKRLKEIYLVSRGVCERGAGGGEGGSGAAVEGVTWGCGRDGGGRACNDVWCRSTSS
jgi:hypothetical protein